MKSKEKENNRKALRNDLMELFIGLAFFAGIFFWGYLGVKHSWWFIFVFFPCSIFLIIGYILLNDSINYLFLKGHKKDDDFFKEFEDEKKHENELLNKYKSSLHVFSWNETINRNIREIFFFDEPQIMRAYMEDIKYSSIMSINVTNKENTIYTSSTSNKNMIGRAIIGGALGGAVGAAIGAATSKRNYSNENRQSEYMIEIKRKDSLYPITIMLKDGVTQILNCNTQKNDEYVSSGMAIDKFIAALSLKINSIIESNISK